MNGQESYFGVITCFSDYLYLCLQPVSDNQNSQTSTINAYVVKTEINTNFFSPQYEEQLLIS